MKQLIISPFWSLTLSKLQHKLSLLFPRQKNVLYNILKGISGEESTEILKYMMSNLFKVDPKFIIIGL